MCVSRAIVGGAGNPALDFETVEGEGGEEPPDSGLAARACAAEGIVRPKGSADLVVRPFTSVSVSHKCILSRVLPNQCRPQSYTTSSAYVNVRGILARVVRYRWLSFRRKVLCP
jgi:hypothetical protein